jgi:acyl carrier protein
MQSAFDIVKGTILRQVSSGILPEYITRLDLSPETRLLDLGIDSLGKMTLLVELQDYLPQGFPVESMGEGTTLGDVAARMVEA